MYEKPLTVLVGLVVFAVALFAASSYPCGYKETWIDAVSGSTKVEHRMLWSEPSVSVERSALWAWMENHGRNVDYRWTFLSSTSESVFGSVPGRGCGTAPPIYPLRGGLGERFVANASDEELAEFIDAMESGSKSWQEAAVAKACEDALRAMETNSGRSH